MPGLRLPIALLVCTSTRVLADALKAGDGQTATIVGTPWWSSLIGVVAGVVLGYGLAELREFLRRDRERRGHLEALAVEIQVCSDLAGGYIVGKVMAPAYRMPLVAYERSFPILISEGILSLEEINAVARFYLNAGAFNLGVDQAQAVLMKRNEDRPPERLEHEVNRARLKARKLLRTGTASHYTAAMAAISRHLPTKARARLKLPEEELVEEESRAA